MQAHMQDFDPDGPGIDNGNLFGLPHSQEEAALWVLPLPWDTTVSYRSGTSLGPSAILAASTQVDLYDPSLPDAWQYGMFLLDAPQWVKELNQAARTDAETIIQALEKGEQVSDQQSLLAGVNDACVSMIQWVEEQSAAIVQKNKIPAILGGDHSTPLGLLQALGKRYSEFGILQIDAHMDLRKAYEGFTFSHASIMWNAIQIPSVSRLVQVGVRDYCQEEVEVVDQSNGKILLFPYREIEKKAYSGLLWGEQVQQIVSTLPQKVYLSFDIDGLAPSLCPDTGTPVPGGLNFEQALYLIETISESGREIIGFDLCEVAPGQNEWNAIVGARVLYRLYVETIKSTLKQQSHGKRPNL